MEQLKRFSPAVPTLVFGRKHNETWILKTMKDYLLYLKDHLQSRFPRFPIISALVKLLNPHDYPEANADPEESNNADTALTLDTEEDRTHEDMEDESEDENFDEEEVGELLSSEQKRSKSSTTLFLKKRRVDRQ